MSQREAVIEKIQGAFEGCEYPFSHTTVELPTKGRVFVSAIVAYLRYKRDADPDVHDGAAIDAALESFWLEREKTAPSAESLRRHVAEQEEYLAATRSSMEDSSGER